MALFLQKLYDDTRDLEMNLVAGKQGLTNVVKGIHMVEHEEISAFLEQGEIVFTTGAGLECESDLYQLVRKNHENGASGMVINIGPFIHGIPDSVREYCNDKGFPLFQVPWHIQMTRIMKRCMVEVMKSETMQMELSAAIETAITFPTRTEQYIPTFEKYNLRPGWKYCVSVLEIADGEHMENSLRTYRRTAAENYLVQNFPGTIVIEMDRRYVLVFPKYEDTETEKAMRRFIKDFFWNMDYGVQVYFGIGQSVNGIEQIGTSYSQALNVVDVKKRGISGISSPCYRDLGEYKILMSIKQEHVLEDFYREYLYPLAAYDQANRTDYVKFLESYLKNNCNVHETSSQLYLHRNTVNYKLNKIGKILNCDLSNLRDKTRLILAYMIYYMRG